jgi:hypothetical protein
LDWDLEQKLYHLPLKLLGPHWQVLLFAPEKKKMSKDGLPLKF